MSALCSLPLVPLRFSNVLQMIGGKIGRLLCHVVKYMSLLQVRKVYLTIVMSGSRDLFGGLRDVC